MAALGWSAIALAGIGAGCVLVLVGSVGLRSWRYFRPLPASTPTSQQDVPPRHQDGRLAAMEMHLAQIDNDLRTAILRINAMDGAATVRAVEFDKQYSEMRASLDALRAIVGASLLPPRQMRLDPTAHDGTIFLGVGAFLFIVRFFVYDSNAIGVSKADTNLKAIARVRDAQSGEMVRLSDHDHSSRDYVIKAGEHFVAENEGGHFMIARIDGVEFEGRAGASRHEVRFTFRLELSDQLGVAAI